MMLLLCPLLLLRALQPLSTDGDGGDGDGEWRRC